MYSVNCLEPLVFVLFALQCSVYFFVNLPSSYPTTMGNFEVPINHTNYDIKAELDLVDCDYVMPHDENTEVLSSIPTDLKVLQLNIRGLLNKQDRLVTLLHEHKVDIALLCETWLNNKTEKLLRLPNYKIYSNNRVDKIGGGVCVLSNNELRSRI